MYDTYITIVLLIKLFPGASEVGSSQRHPGAFRNGWQRGHLRRLAGNAVEQRVILGLEKVWEKSKNDGNIWKHWDVCVILGDMPQKKWVE